MSESSSETPRRSRLSSGVSHWNRQAARTGKAAVGTVLAAALMSGIGVAPSVAADTVTEPPTVRPDQSEQRAVPSGATDTATVQRLGEIAAELDHAVERGEVTLEQALAFFAQVQARATRG